MRSSIEKERSGRGDPLLISDDEEGARLVVTTSRRRRKPSAARRRSDGGRTTCKERYQSKKEAAAKGEGSAKTAWRHGDATARRRQRRRGDAAARRRQRRRGGEKVKRVQPFFLKTFIPPFLFISLFIYQVTLLFLGLGRRRDQYGRRRQDTGVVTARWHRPKRGRSKGPPQRRLSHKSGES